VYLQVDSYDEVCVRIGCYSSGTCSATVKAYSKTYDDPDFSLITYTSQGTAVPELTMNNVTLEYWGGDAVDGGVFNINGNCKLLVSDSTIQLNQGRFGGVIYMTGNTAGTRFENTKMYINNAKTSGGIGYFATGNENIEFVNINSRYVSGSGTVSGNEAETSGGDFFFGDGNKNILIDGQDQASSASTCGSSYAGEGKGGAIALDTNNENVLIKGISFSKGTCYYGGTVYVGIGNKNVVVQDCQFDGSEARQWIFSSGTLDGFGGAVYVSYKINPNHKSSSSSSLSSSSLSSLSHHCHHHHHYYYHHHRHHHYHHHIIVVIIVTTLICDST
jgi:hypothetical protein